MFVVVAAATEQTLFNNQAERWPTLITTSRFGWFKCRAAHGGKSRSSCMMWSSRNFNLSVIEFGGSGTGWKIRESVRSQGRSLPASVP